MSSGCGRLYLRRELRQARLGNNQLARLFKVKIRHTTSSCMARKSELRAHDLWRMLQNRHIMHVFSVREVHLARKSTVCRLTTGSDWAGNSWLSIWVQQSAATAGQAVTARLWTASCGLQAIKFSFSSNRLCVYHRRACDGRPDFADCSKLGKTSLTRQAR